MEYKVTGKIINNGKNYLPGDAWDGSVTDEELSHLVATGMLEEVVEATQPTKKAAKASKGKKAEPETTETTQEPEEEEQKGADEKKSDAPQPVATNIGKAKLMEIGKEEGVELDETMTPEEMRLVINKARGVE